ncbi:MAG TPA: putative toxin-antitoxin system toxin component, PIN family [Mucilaginibacter sp.]|jgi:putative PIN family toxin of toxin-antitoxin system
MKVVIDTNVLVSIISKRSSSRWVFDSIISGKIQICVSTEIILEYKEILQRKTNFAVSENISEFMSVSPYVEKTDIFFRFNLIEKDSTDNKFVDCAISADADCIISNDKHFQILKTITFPKVNVLTLNEFEKYKLEITS